MTHQDRLDEIAKLLRESATVTDAWHIYAELIIPKSAGHVQRRETKRAFYAGADWIFQRLLNASSGEEMGAINVMQSFSKEIDDYKKGVHKGLE